MIVVLFLATALTLSAFFWFSSRPGLFFENFPDFLPEGWRHGQGLYFLHVQEVIGNGSVTVRVPPVGGGLVCSRLAALPRPAGREHGDAALPFSGGAGAVLRLGGEFPALGRESSPGGFDGQEAGGRGGATCPGGTRTPDPGGAFPGRKDCHPGPGGVVPASSGDSPGGFAWGGDSLRRR